ncbi:ATPase [Nocardia sp. ET3-3]|uniref:ATPase n=1 Tax=Nocardia terrae TaxID=2675851 RepID=A0A7K1V757_9NOCA|nr:SRPBCC family protein [Nocardia terrae]MVU82480.1 ATPase [Nocardia terrae]
MTQQIDSHAVTVQLTVDAPIDKAYRVFTTDMDTWWPRDHHIGAGPLAEAVVEPRVGGRLYGRETDGTECGWGRVLVWNPSTHFAFSWDINLDWKPESDPAATSRVDVRFTAVDAEHTTVTLVHSGFENHGPGWEAMRDAVASPGGWPGLQQNYAVVVAA